MFDFTFGIDEAARKAARYSIISGLPLLVLVVLDTRMKPDPLQLDSTQDDEENVKYQQVFSFPVHLFSSGRQFTMRIFRRCCPPKASKVGNKPLELAISVGTNHECIKKYNTAMNAKSGTALRYSKILSEALRQEKAKCVVPSQGDVKVPRYCPNQSSCAVHCAMAFLLCHFSEIINKRLGTLSSTDINGNLIELWRLLQPTWTQSGGGTPLYTRPKGKGKKKNSNDTNIHAQNLLSIVMSLVCTEHDSEGTAEDSHEIMLTFLSEKFFDCDEAMRLLTVRL